jgi:hypothetical protein
MISRPPPPIDRMGKHQPILLSLLHNERSSIHCSVGGPPASPALSEGGRSHNCRGAWSPTQLISDVPVDTFALAALAVMTEWKMDL